MSHILIATGGTGGHVFPAQAYAEKMRAQGHTVHFIGSQLNRYLPNEPFLSISVGSLRHPLKILRGVVQSIKHLRQLRPQEVIGFGSYYSFPPLIAAIVLRIPISLHEGDAVAGRVTRFLSPFAKKVLAPFPKVEGVKKIEQIEPLVRAHFRKYAKKEARVKLGLDPDRLTILVFGGSQGAKALNSYMLKEAPYLEQMQIIHLTGEDPAPYQEAYNRLEIPSYVRPFSQEMDLLWSCADVAFTRAGSATIAEHCYFGVPTIFVPYPHATRDHQWKNAQALDTKRLVVREKDLERGSLIQQLELIKCFVGGSTAEEQQI